MLNLCFKTFFLLLSVYGNFGKTIQNNTDDSKVVTTDMLDVWKKNMTDFVTNLIEKGCKNEKNHVYFHAKMISENVALNANSIVKFSNVLVNEGNHFNAGDSVFVAPASGVYLFSWTTQTHTGKAVNTELRVDDAIKETLHVNIAASSGEYASATRVIICKVRENDHVWIQTSNKFQDNMFDYEYGSQSSFMGILMYKA